MCDSSFQGIDVEALRENSTLEDHKVRLFKRTVLAVNSVVQRKVYKRYCNSLETYFKDYWNMSRAQVYRYMDCAIIFYVIPLSLIFRQNLHLLPFRSATLYFTVDSRSFWTDSRNSRVVNVFAARSRP